MTFERMLKVNKIVVVLALCVCAVMADLNCSYTERGRFTNSIPATFDRMGASAGIYKNTAVYGIPEQTVNGLDNAGGALVYEKNSAGNWTFAIGLVADSLEASAEFGHSVDAADDFIAVGAHFMSRNGTQAGVGGVYIFSRLSGSWVSHRFLQPAFSNEYTSFGAAIAMSNLVLAVGMPSGDVPTQNSGAVYLYARNLGGNGNWGLLKTLLCPTPATNARFGGSVAVQDPNHLAVGASTNGSGVVYIFGRMVGGSNNYGLSHTLTAPSELPASNTFGASIAIGGDNLAVGVPEVDANRGKVFVYSTDSNDQWTLTRDVQIPNPANGDRCGLSVGITATTVFVGCPGRDTAKIDNGVVFIAEIEEGGATATLIPQEEQSTMAFGSSFAVDPATLTRMAIGAPGFEVGPSSSAGAGYVFECKGDTSSAGRPTLSWAFLL